MSNRSDESHAGNTAQTGLFALAARHFQSLAGELMARLAGQHGVTLEQIGRLHYRFDLEREQSSGYLDEWRYCFHGYECAFDNRITGQNVDVLLGFGTEFGVLDPWFFRAFVETTPEYKALLSWLPTHESACQVLDTLTAHGVLVTHTGEILYEDVRRTGKAAART